MNISLNTMIEHYGLATIVIAAVTAVAVFIADRYLKKLPLAVRNYLPIIISLSAEFLYDMIAVGKCVRFTSEAFYGGLAAGSLATALAVTAKKIAGGEGDVFCITALFIEGLLEGYVEDALKAEVALIIFNLLSEETEETRLWDRISDVLDKNCSQKMSVAEKSAIIGTILLGTKPKNK